MLTAALWAISNILTCAKDYDNDMSLDQAGLDIHPAPISKLEGREMAEEIDFPFMMSMQCCFTEHRELRNIIRQQAGERQAIGIMIVRR